MGTGYFFGRASWLKKVACPLFLCAQAFAQDLNVAAQADKTEVATGEKLVFAVTIAGPMESPPKIHLASFEGFRVLSTGQSQQIQLAGGESRLSLTLTYTLAPTTPGTHLLGPVKIEYKGRLYETQPIEVKVLESPKKDAPPAPGKAKLKPKRPLPVELEGGVVL